ncbi:hypothetical protein Hanom_Chr02g00121121 [Helianthus anomalus]
MHSFNCGYDSTNPFGYQETPNSSPPQNRQPTNRPSSPFIYSSLPDLVAAVSYIGNRVCTNFPYGESSIPVINLSQPDSVPETQPQDVSGSSSKPAKKRSHKKWMRRKP